MTLTEANIACSKEADKFLIAINMALLKCSRISDPYKVDLEYSMLVDRIGECVQCIERFVDDCDRPQSESKPLSPILECWAAQYERALESEIKTQVDAGSNKIVKIIGLKKEEYEEVD